MRARPLAGVISALTACVCASPAAAARPNWDLIVSDLLQVNFPHGRFQQRGALVRVDPLTGAEREITGFGRRGNFLHSPGDVAVAQDGSIYVTYDWVFGHGAVIKVNPVTGEQKVIARYGVPGSLIYDPGGLAIAPDRTLVVTDFSGPGGSRALGELGGVLRVDPATGAQTVIARSDQAGALLGQPTSLTISVSGRILVSNFASFARSDGHFGGIVGVDPFNSGCRRRSRRRIRPRGTCLRGPAGSPSSAAGRLSLLRRGSISGRLV